MSNKLIAGLLVGATFLAASLSSPAQANNNYQNLLNLQAMQAYQQNLANQQYAGYGYGYGNPYGYGIGSGIGAPGINPNDPNAFKEAQYQQWAATQGGNGFRNQSFVNNAHPSFNGGWGGGRSYFQGHR